MSTARQLFTVMTISLRLLAMASPLVTSLFTVRARGLVVDLQHRRQHSATTRRARIQAQHDYSQSENTSIARLLAELKYKYSTTTRRKVQQEAHGSLHQRWPLDSSS